MNQPKKATLAGRNPLHVVPPIRPSYEDIPLINPKKQPLTPIVLRTFEGFESISEEEAENICRTSLLFAQMLLEFMAHRNATCIDNQPIVYSDSEDDTPVIDIRNSKINKRKAA